MTTIMNKDTYFKQKVILNDNSSTINITTKPFLNINNMSVIADISINTVTINNGIIDFTVIKPITNNKINFMSHIVNDRISKVSNPLAIGSVSTMTNSTNTYTLDDITILKEPITISIKTGVYIFDYSYNINSNSTTSTIYQLYEYIDNRTTNINILTKNNTFTYTNTLNINGTQYNTTYGVIEGAPLVNQNVVFGIKCVTYSALTNITFSNFNLRCTRIA